MKMSEEISTEPCRNIKATPARRDELTDDELKCIDEIYASTCVQYKDLLMEYEVDKARNKKIKKYKCFQTIANWKPLRRHLSDFEKEVVAGPQSSTTILKHVELREPGTGQWFTYSSKAYESSKRVVSSYVCVNHGICDKAIPIFGRIAKAFQRSFASTVTYFVVVDVYDTATFNTELSMWFVKPSVTKKGVFLLEDVSHPLVVAEDETHALL